MIDAQETAHYTPKDMAAHLVRQTLEPLASKVPRIIDTACGDGMLLMAAADYLLKRGYRAADIARNLHGIDINIEAVKACERNLETKLGDKPNIRHGDAMLSSISQPSLFDDSSCLNFESPFDVVIMNPPFAGKSTLARIYDGDHMTRYLTNRYDGHGNADLAAYFVRHAWELLTPGGTMGVIATNTISQGDTRQTGLKQCVKDDGRVYWAKRDVPWPGDANVTVTLFAMRKGAGIPRYDSRLRPYPERNDPAPLKANEGGCYQGSIILGMGFVLTPEERDALIAKDPRNGERIFPYIGGKEVNTSPTQAFHRYVINFGDMALEEAEKWPDLIAIVREKVKPERDRLKDNADGRRRKKHWWQFGRWTPALYAALEGQDRCLVTAQVAKHLFLSFQKSTMIFAAPMLVFPLQPHTPFSVLQSRLHERWTRLLSSSMKTSLRYAPTDCFATFPFPQLSPAAVIESLETFGKTLSGARAQFMIDTDQGLTETYNALKDPNAYDPRVLELRAMHEELDRLVLEAYGWDDLTPPPFTSDDPWAEVTDRLFELNQKRSNSPE